MARLFQISPSFLVYTPTADQEAVGFPVSRIAALHPHPLDRHWRSDNTNAQNIDADCAVSVLVKGIGIYGGNFTEVHPTWSTDGVLYTPFTGSSFTIQKKREHYNLYIDEEVTARYIRLTIPQQTPVDGNAYFKLGLLWIAVEIIAIPPPERALRGSGSTTYISNSIDSVPAGPVGIEESWQVVTLNDELADVERVFLRTQHLTQLVYEGNPSDRSATYLIRTAGEPSFERYALHQVIDAPVKWQV